MPTQIHNPRQSSRERYFARQSTYRLAKQSKFTQVLQAPWMGWVPDLPVHIVGWQGYRTGRGLVSVPYENRGMTLRHDDGYERVDFVGTDLPLGRTVVGDPVGPPIVAAQDKGQFAVTMIGQYFDAANNPNRIVILAGDPTALANPVEIYAARMNPATGAWAELNDEVGITANTIPTGNREALWDHCVFPFGAPTRVDATYGVHAPIWTGITGPCMVFCNADYDGPVDNVMITPVDDAIANPETFYDELSDTSGAVAPGPNFKAASCESFDGRVHFLNTSEAGTAYPQRHRWTGIGTADPDESIVGSGWLNLAEFQRGGKRIESMQDKLALYFGDGVAFQVPTRAYFDAYRPQIVSRTRGLLGGQGLCAITPHLHFGIFNDGWWTLDSSGRWSKIGRLILEETRGKSHELTKWEDTFYEDLDFDQTQRICCVYDRYRELVRIAYPSKSTGGENYVILNYHMKTDTCWRDQYSTPTTAWGILDLQQTAAGPWGDPPTAALPGSWGSQTVTWGSQAAQYKEEVVCHGNGPTIQSVWNVTAWDTGYTLNGSLVFSRNPNLYTYDGQTVPIQYITHEVNVNENPLLDQTFHRFGIEYVRTDTSSAIALQVNTDDASTKQAQFLYLNEGTLGTVNTVYGHFRLHGTAHGFGIYGSAPLVIRSLVPEMMLYVHDDRDGQV